MKKNIQAVLFDLDGVLVDSLDAWYYAFCDALKHFGKKKISYEVFKKNFGSSAEEEISTIFKGVSMTELVSFYNLAFKSRSEFVRLNSEAIPTLEKVKELKMKTCIITNSTRPITMEFLDNFRIKKYFDEIVTMEDVKNGKPAPDMVLKACSLLGIRPADAIVVGDTINDMLAGKSAGCTTIGYKIKGDFKIEELGEIINFIK